MNLRIDIKDNLTPRVVMLMRMLSGAKRVEMMRGAGVAVQELTREHIGNLKRKPGSWASQQKAPTTGFYKEAAQEVASPAAVSATSNEAVLTITSRGFSRAFRDVTVEPRTARALTIPIHPEAFGKRASDLWDRLEMFIPKGKRVIYGVVGGVLTPLYVLVRRVVQKQDRSLLPSDEEFRREAAKSVRKYVVMMTTLTKG